MTGELEPVKLTDAQRDKFLALLKANRMMGNVAALREAGVQGTKRDLRAILDDELHEQAREARGWSLVEVEQTTWDVAKDPEHASWDRANARVLKAYHPAYRDQARIEHTGADGGPMEVRNPDVAAAIERFTSTVLRLAERGPAELPPGAASR